MADKRQITFHVSPAEGDVLDRLAGKNKSEYLRRLVALDAARHGIDWPDELHDTRGKYDRELELDRLEVALRGLPPLADDD